MRDDAVYRIQRDPFESRGFFPVFSEEDLTEGEEVSRLDAPARDPGAEPLGIALNTAFPDVETRARAFLETIRKPRLRFTLAGLGDVGGQLLTALKLLSNVGADAFIGPPAGTDPDPEGEKGGCGHPPLQGVPEISEIGIFDPNEALCRRWELELNQILDRPLPRVRILGEEELFRADLFLFTASRGVPPLGTAGDVRMLQFEKNREMLRSYAKAAREAGFSGLFCQISDPVDLLARCVFLQSNRDEAGTYDFRGLLPEQVVGFGLGVMKARAVYMAERLGAACPGLRAYGPHGAGLVVANDPAAYDEDLSLTLTRLTVGANREVRDLGFKPFVAPAISSAALSILSLLRGEAFHGAVPMGGVYFGCVNRLTAGGFALRSEALHPELTRRLRAAWTGLKEEEPLCRI